MQTPIARGQIGNINERNRLCWDSGEHEAIGFVLIGWIQLIVAMEESRASAGRSLELFENPEIIK